MPSLPLLLWWLLGCVVLEQSAPRLPFFGTFRTLFAWTIGWLGATLLGAEALACAWLILALRERGPKDRVTQGVEVLAGLAGALAGGLAQVAGLPLPLLSLLVLGVATGAHQLLLRRAARTQAGADFRDWLRVERGLTSLAWGGAAASWLALALPPGDLARLALLPVLLGLQGGASNALFRAQAQVAQETWRSATGALRANVDLQRRLESREALLELSWRFGHQLTVGPLWEGAVAWYSSVLPLEGLALQDPEGEFRWGTGAEGVWQQLAEARGSLYRRGLRPGVDLVALEVPSVPLRFAAVFRGSEPLTEAQQATLRGATELLATAWSRARLYQSLVDACRSLTESRDRWLATHKSLALAQLSAGVAHELNSPLAAIQLALERLLARGPEPTLQSALTACTRARDIIARLGVEARTAEAEAAGTEVVSVTRLVLQQLQPTLERQGVECSVEGVAQDVWPVGRQTFESLITPLLLNAVEAVAGQPAPRVVVRLEPGLWVVEDNGPGLPPEHVARILEPFFTTGTIGTHAGLGLSTCDQLCRRVGVSLDFGNRPSGGAWFRLQGASQQAAVDVTVRPPVS